MPKILQVIVTDETLAQVERYCRITGKKPEKIINQDWSYGINDMIGQYSDLRFDYESKVYRSLRAARLAAKKYWSYQDGKWQEPLHLRFMHEGQKREGFFECAATPPENWLRRADGYGFMFIHASTSQEEINRLVDRGIL